jgi:hypothetical protein
MRKPSQQIVVFVALLMAACSTNSATDPTRPKIDIEETQGAVIAATGPFDIQYQLTIANPSNQPITLRRVELTVTGGSTSPYSLQRRPYIFEQTIPAGTTGTVTFWAHAYANYYPGSSGAQAPVSIRGVAIFDAPHGSFQQVFNKLLPQESY